SSGAAGTGPPLVVAAVFSFSLSSTLTCAWRALISDCRFSSGVFSGAARSLSRVAAACDAQMRADSSSSAAYAVHVFALLREFRERLFDDDASGGLNALAGR